MSSVQLRIPEGVEYEVLPAQPASQQQQHYQQHQMYPNSSDGIKVATKGPAAAILTSTGTCTGTGNSYSPLPSSIECSF